MARLRLEHAHLSRVLREIEVQRARLGRDPAAVAVLAEALAYLVDYQHVHHHPREDALYQRLIVTRADLAGELGALEREHAGGARQARRLAHSIAGLHSAGTPERPAARLSRDLQRYVDETRDHMRREERVVFHGDVEHWLAEEEWRALTACLPPDDPLADANELRRRYPHLAAALAEPVREVLTRSREMVGDPHARSLSALREGAADLVDAYGELLHEGFDLARANAVALWSAPWPFGPLAALPELGRRSYRYATRCVSLPSRVALDCAGRMLAPFAPPADDATSADPG
ncbi:MAG: hemerythrin domain-containing protein [Proteobacteria bacterium]|nr:hemerythrin domain-containing protein [Pseudomonadota bacterium]